MSMILSLRFLANMRMRPTMGKFPSIGLASLAPRPNIAMWPFSEPRWKTVAASKQSLRDDEIQKVASVLPAVREDSSKDEQYTSASSTQIVQNISEGKWLAVDVTAAYIRRATYVQSLHNPMTEVLFTEALNQARTLDENFKKTGQLKGPLHGVPMSIKDQFDISGYDSSIGFSAWCNAPATSDAAVVEAVRKAGAVIICKTNVPQTMLNIECTNPVWGKTTNPWNSAYTCGGSSGGEGCVLGADATALGVGSDVGGSLRIPALYCGAYSLKPGAGRIPNRGARSSNPGFDAIKVTPGPMGRSVEDVERLSRVLFASTPENDSEGIAPVPYRNVKLPSKLRIGYYFEDGFIRTSPANRRAVQETVDALEKAGHEVVKFELPFGPQSIQLFAALTSGDGYRTLMSPSGGDPIERNLFLVTLGPKLFRWLQIFGVWFIKNVLKDPVFADTFSMSRHSTLTRFWKNSAWMKDVNREFYKLVWDKYHFDAIIAPGMACPALPHGASTRLSPLANGTFYYNVIDSPVGAIPVTRVSPEDVITEEWKAASDVPKNDANPNGGSWILNDGLYGRNGGGGGAYDPVKMKGLPVGIQVVGRNWEDEKVLAVMSVVDNALGPRGFGPGAWKPEG